MLFTSCFPHVKQSRLAVNHKANVPGCDVMICDRFSPIDDDFLWQKSVMCGYGVLFLVNLNELLSKYSTYHCFEAHWGLCNAMWCDFDVVKHLKPVQHSDTLYLMVNNLKWKRVSNQCTDRYVSMMISPVQWSWHDKKCVQFSPTTVNTFRIKVCVYTEKALCVIQRLVLSIINKLIYRIYMCMEWIKWDKTKYEPI